MAPTKNRCLSILNRVRAEDVDRRVRREGTSILPSLNVRDLQRLAKLHGLRPIKRRKAELILYLREHAYTSRNPA